MNERIASRSRIFRWAIVPLVALALPAFGQSPKEAPRARAIVAPKVEAKLVEIPQAKAAPKPQVPAANPSAEGQAAEIQKQIDELQKKLDAIKKAAAAPTKTSETSIPPDFVKALNWRALGPANMGGRVVAMSVFEADPSTYFIATGGGGLVKTINNGVTFEHQFDKEATVSIGDVCVAPSDKQHRLGRHRREQPAQLRLLRRRRLQVDRRRQEVDEHGS